MKNFVPRKYQESACEFLFERKEVALIADMGLGKTAMCLHAVIDLMLDLQIRGVLVVAPKRVATITWPVEVESWDSTNFLSYQILHGPKKDKAFDTPAHLYFINYEGLVWLIEKLKKLKPEKWPFDMIIFDELTFMKSSKSVRFKKFKKYAKMFKRKIGLTGTPSPQGLTDLWAQYYMLDGGERLGTTFSAFRSRYFYATDYMQYTWAPHAGAKENIYGKVEDMTLRIAQEGNLDLPPCTIKDTELTMPKEARELYEEFEKKMFAVIDNPEESEIEAPTAAVLSMRCSQISSGAIYIDDKRNWEELHTEKMKALIKIVKDTDGPVLVAYSFTHESERIQAQFPDAVVLKSGISIEKERQIMKDWDEGKIPMLVCHPKSAGHGLNLQHGSHTAIWFSLPWSLEYYLQLNKRLHRQGQTHEVTIHRLLMTKTTDCAVASALERKEGSQLDFLNALAVYNKHRGLL